MRRLDRYIFRQIAGPFLFFVLVFTGTVWLGRSLNLIETVVNNARSAGVFLELAALMLPRVLMVVLPVAAFAATLHAVNRLFSDSEIVVMFATGLSRAALVRPVALFAALVTLAGWALTLGIAPAAQGIFKARVAEVQGDIVSAFLREGAFESPAAGVTVYLRGQGRPGEMLGLFVHDERDPDETATYTAERAVLLSDEAGTRIVMFDGTLQIARPRVAGRPGSEALSILRFAQIAYDLTRFIASGAERQRRPSEYYLSELLAVTEAQARIDGRPFGAYRATAHEAIAGPLYAPVFALIALAFVVGPGFRRRGILGRILAAAGTALTLRLVGLAMKGLTTGEAALWPLFYLPHLLGLALAAWLLAGAPRPGRRGGRPGGRGRAAPVPA